MLIDTSQQEAPAPDEASFIENASSEAGAYRFLDFPNLIDWY